MRGDIVGQREQFLVHQLLGAGDHLIAGGVGAGQPVTNAGTSSDCSSAAIFFRTSRAASFSVGVSCASSGSG